MPVKFAPQLHIPNGITDVSFYEKALGAVEVRRFSDDDGTIHVVEFKIGDVLFHLHEQKTGSNTLCPAELNGAYTTTIGLFVDDVDAVIVNAVAAGADLASPAQDYEYGYRQGQFIDPFGHRWEISKMI